MFHSRKRIIRAVSKSLAQRLCGRSYACTGAAVIRPGDCLPHCDLYEDFPTNAISMAHFAAGKNLVMFIVLGAFAPSCSRTQLPSYLNASATMKRDGIDEIVCVSVNDAYVMGAWARHQQTKGKIRMFADPTGCFTYALGIGMNCSEFGGFRAMRASMVVVNNTVMELHVEPDGVGLACTLAEDLCYKPYIRNKGLKS